MKNIDVVKEFELFSLNIGGIGQWITNDTEQSVLDRLSLIDSIPLSKVQLNQLLVLGHEAPVSDGFFNYYWIKQPKSHPYCMPRVYDFDEKWLNGKEIVSLKHLKWGLYRLFMDSLMFFGNVRTGYRELRKKSHVQLVDFFTGKCFPTEELKLRGKPIPLKHIAKDSRYLISEMACKSYSSKDEENLKDIIINAYDDHAKINSGPVRVSDLISGEFVQKKYSARQTELSFSAEEFIDDIIESREDLKPKLEAVFKKFTKARKSALLNTSNYLSMVNELDVYVATSMRNRADFRAMGEKTEKIFNSSSLIDLHLRYFDPTLSASNGHEDKGIIECLMVKCAKVLVYCAGEKESYGKDAEAAMALSQGKAVIFLCDHESKTRFYRDVHPLSRLIEFDTGVAVGAIITDKVDDVIDLLLRIFKNEMDYTLEKDADGCLRLVESLTGSKIRFQSGDRLLTETFWNHYHGD